MQIKDENVQIKITRVYKDKELDRMTVIDEIITVSSERAALLVEMGYAQKTKSKEFGTWEQS